MAAEVVLILTAGFGDGHNSAARGVAAALEAASGGRVRAEVVDLFTEAAPLTGNIYKSAYQGVINRFPRVWDWFYKWTAGQDFRELWWDRFVGLRRALERRLESMKPRMVFLTYPLYAYFLRSMDAGVHRPAQVWMAVTDSITIHPMWLRGGVDRMFVTDARSAREAIAGRVPSGSVRVAGFPVSPKYADFPRREAGRVIPGRFRVLFFATTSASHVRTTLRALLESAGPGWEITVAAGRNHGRLFRDIESITKRFPAVSVTVLGWTNGVPELLRAHDVVISKAGGATTHECIAAGVPLILNYIIPGQEEGNAQLIETLACGARECDAAASGALPALALRDGRWEEWSRSMAAHQRPDGSVRIANEILDYLNMRKL